MDSNDSHSIIHKKARVAREDFDARAMSPAKALRVSLAKTADRVLGLPLIVSTLEQTIVTTEDLLTQIDGQGMLILLDGAMGARGVASLDCQVVSALIEKQIAGQVLAAEAEPRSYTRTDAAMMAPILDQTLIGLDDQQSAHNPDHIPGNFRFGDKVDDTRAMSLLLEGGSRFDLFRLTVELEDGAKSGVIMLALPLSPPKTSDAPEDKADTVTVSRKLEKHALDATVTLTAVVARLNLPLNEICALQPGMTLPVAAKNLTASQLVAPPRHLVADVHLGQLAGMRAVRVMMPGGEAQPRDGGSQPMPDAGPAYPSDADLDLPAAPMGLPMDMTADLPVDLTGNSASIDMDLSMSMPGADDEGADGLPDPGFDLDLPEPLPMLPIGDDA